MQQLRGYACRGGEATRDRGGVLPRLQRVRGEREPRGEERMEHGEQENPRRDGIERIDVNTCRKNRPERLTREIWIGGQRKWEGRPVRHRFATISRIEPVLLVLGVFRVSPRPAQLSRPWESSIMHRLSNR